MPVTETFPTDGENPWGSEIRAWAQAVMDDLNIRLSDTNLDARIQSGAIAAANDAIAAAMPTILESVDTRITQAISGLTPQEATDLFIASRINLTDSATQEALDARIALIAESVPGEPGEPGIDGAVFVYHGANASFPRPNTGGRAVIWIGSVVPANRTGEDFYMIPGEEGTDPGEPSPFVGAFDTFAAPHRAVSLRRLLSAYTGPLIRVRRATDNTELDIGYTASGDLDATALASFAGSASVYVVTWYDQSGNSRHFSQATAAAQPRIMNAGALDMQNGKPAVVFDGTDDLMFSTVVGLFAAGVASMAGVFMGVAASNSVLLQESSIGNNSALYRIVRSSTANWNTQGSGNTGTSLWASSSTGNDVFDSLQHQLFFVDSVNIINTWKDGTAKHVNLSAPRAESPTFGQTVLGANRGSTAVNNFLNGKVQEIITWASDRTAERAGISAAQKNYWGTP